MSTEIPNTPEARIGYNTLQLANAPVSQSNYGGVGTTGLSKGSSTGYLDYLDYDTSNDNLNYATSNLYNNNNYGLTGLGQSYGSTSYDDNLSYRQLLRRRQGLLAGGAGGFNQLNQLSQYGGGGRQLNNAAGSAGQLNQLSQVGNSPAAGQLSQLGNQLGFGGSGQLGNTLGQLGNLGKVDNLGLASSGYGNTGLGYGGTGGGYGGGYGGPVSIVSGYGPSQQCETGINPLLALLTLAGAAVGFYFMYIRLTMSTGRKFPGKYQASDFESVLDFAWMGLEEFEDKVDKIANGQDDESWIGQLYNQFSTNLGIDGGKIDDEDIGSMDGLEPPIIDEKWGLEDIRKLHEPEDSPIEEPRSRSKRDLDQNNVEETKEDEEEDDVWTKSLEGDSKCKARFWKCIGKVASGSLHYMDEPGGVSGAVKKMLFRMAFHGGIGNFWKALMTIPEARDVKRCMNKQDDCMSFEVLRKEVQTLDGETFVSPNEKRLLINPEFVESMDNSDGSEQFSPEDQAIEDREMDNQNN